MIVRDKPGFYELAFALKGSIRGRRFHHLRHRALAVPGFCNNVVLTDLLDQIPEAEEIVTVTGDGAFDTRRCHSAILSRGGTAVIPIRKNGRLWREDCPAALARNDILRATRHLGRTIWKKWSGCNVRSRIEARMRNLKSFGERIASRDTDRQAAEIHIRVALMNRFNARGTAEIERVA